MTPKTKTCVKCEWTKEASKFNKSSSSKDGLQSWCRKCSLKYSRAADKAKVEGTPEKSPVRHPRRSRTSRRTLVACDFDKARDVAEVLRGMDDLARARVYSLVEEYYKA